MVSKGPSGATADLGNTSYSHGPFLIFTFVISLRAQAWPCSSFYHWKDSIWHIEDIQRMFSKCSSKANPHHKSVHREENSTRDTVSGMNLIREIKYFQWVSFKDILGYLSMYPFHILNLLTVVNWKGQTLQHRVIYSYSVKSPQSGVSFHYSFSCGGWGVM